MVGPSKSKRKSTSNTATPETDRRGPEVLGNRREDSAQRRPGPPDPRLLRLGFDRHGGVTDQSCLRRLGAELKVER